MLNVSSDAKMKANLAHLKRLDAEIQDILQSGTHVTMYEFDPINTTWSRFDCEGPIFIVKRSSAPRFKMCILNRNSKVNFMRAVTSEFVVQISENDKRICDESRFKYRRAGLLESRESAKVSSG